MRGYKKALTEYLQSIGQLEAQPLGKANEFTDLQKQWLERELERQYIRNQVFLWTASVLWVILFALGVYFAIMFRRNATNLSVVLGGNLMVLSGNVLALRRLWLDSSIMGVLLAILPALSPKEAAKVIANFYFNAIDKKHPEFSAGASRAGQAF